MAKYFIRALSSPPEISLHTWFSYFSVAALVFSLNVSRFHGGVHGHASSDHFLLQVRTVDLLELHRGRHWTTQFPANSAARARGIVRMLVQADHAWVVARWLISCRGLPCSPYCFVYQCPCLPSFILLYTKASLWGLLCQAVKVESVHRQHHAHQCKVNAM